MLIGDEKKMEKNVESASVTGSAFTNCLLSGLDMLQIVEKEWDYTVVSLKLHAKHYIDETWSTSSWLTLIAHGTVARYLTMIVNSMSHLSEYGAQQLSEGRFLNCFLVSLFSCCCRISLFISIKRVALLLSFLLDINYLMNVTSAMGVVTSPMLNYIYELLNMKRNALQVLSDRIERESRDQRNKDATQNSQSNMPRGLLLRICKMRGILTTF